MGTKIDISLLKKGLEDGGLFSGFMTRHKVGRYLGKRWYEYLSGDFYLSLIGRRAESVDDVVGLCDSLDYGLNCIRFGRDYGVRASGCFNDELRSLSSDWSLGCDVLPQARKLLHYYEWYSNDVREKCRDVCVSISRVDFRVGIVVEFRVVLVGVDGVESGYWKPVFIKIVCDGDGSPLSYELYKLKYESRDLSKGWVEMVGLDWFGERLVYDRVLSLLRGKIGYVLKLKGIHKS